jgi:hypothetical protein
MNLIYWIVLALVFLLQVAFGILFVVEKKRSNLRYNAMLSYVDRSTDGVASNCEESTNYLINEHAEKIIVLVKNAISEQNDKIQKQLEDLLLDYTQAQAAASRINDFGASLASIFDYDPMKAIQKGRDKEAK